ncbi:hypothetical protein [Streptomyces sp. NPDC059708]|uniref:hypothetical protein n=1 Tax=Streptomyces sp. NPDC059708 TaxID=3346916 RepID=UPI00369C9AC0
MRQIPVTTAAGKTPCCTNIHTDDTHEVRVIAVVDSGSNLLEALPQPLRGSAW